MKVIFLENASVIMNVKPLKPHQ